MAVRKNKIEQNNCDKDVQFSVLPLGKGRVITIICLLAVSILWLISLVTYSKTDPSFNSYSSNNTVNNAIGLFGSYSSDLLLQGLGFLAYIIPFIIIGFCYALIRKISAKELLSPILGIVLCVFAIDCLISIGWKEYNDFGFPVGGVGCQQVVNMLAGLLGNIGTIIVMTVILAIGLVVGFAAFSEKVAVTITSFILCTIRNLKLVINKKIQNNRNNNPQEYEKGKSIENDTIIKGQANFGNDKIDGEWEVGELSIQEEPEIQVNIPQPDVSVENSKTVELSDNGNNDELNCPEIPNPPISSKNSVIENKNNNETHEVETPTQNNKEQENNNSEEVNSYKLDDEPPVQDYDAEFDDEDDRFPFEDNSCESKKSELSSQISIENIENNSNSDQNIIVFDNCTDSHELAIASKDIKREIAQEDTEFERPPLDFLDFKESEKYEIDTRDLELKEQKLLATLASFGIKGQIRQKRVGPVVIVMEFVPDPGVKISKISSLADDIAMSMEAMQVRIVAPIPGKGAVGIEIPNSHRQVVYLKEIVASEQFRKAKSLLTLCLGKDIEGVPFVADLAKMPHLLIAGATGTGKSVGINAMLTSILYKATPEDVRLIMVDPKQLELSIYEGIPHLLLPVVCDPKKAALALHWAVEEMERRYTMMAELGVRNLAGYNEKIKTLGPEDLISKDGQEFVHLPYIVILIDEFADLMMVASKEIETFVARLAQKARAAGIHLILATQRPSVDVITGTIKANFPSRISFQVSSGHDAKTILDTVGSEHLLGMGDMLYMSAGGFGLTRVHGALVTEKEIEKVVAFLKAQGAPQYDESILAAAENSSSGDDEGFDGASTGKQLDVLYDKAVEFVAKNQTVSVSKLQRYLGIGYNRSANIVEQMERDGIVGPAIGSKPREVLIPPPPEDGY